MRIAFVAIIQRPNLPANRGGRGLVGVAAAGEPLALPSSSVAVAPKRRAACCHGGRPREGAPKLEAREGASGP